ncbi:unnamed protein product [Darwinula stevensoni]|uniref:Uncharacterized protein n=1 Tax=Darwinula stevensoni TaxID=69355 RepID=A0A7R9ACB7_9CRUS|nr:unnamed protein product [Darwinula stevensoni]CAG0899966.1 unnamed protein product [Darwinula stevensoni]
MQKEGRSEGIGWWLWLGLAFFCLMESMLVDGTTISNQDPAPSQLSRYLRGGGGSSIFSRLGRGGSHSFIRLGRTIDNRWTPLPRYVRGSSNFIRLGKRLPFDVEEAQDEGEGESDEDLPRVRAPRAPYAPPNIKRLIRDNFVRLGKSVQEDDQQ